MQLRRLSALLVSITTLTLPGITLARVLATDGDRLHIDSSQLQMPPALSETLTPQQGASDRVARLHQQAQSRNTRTREAASWTLGLLYLHGAGVPQDGTRARQWFEQALQLGHPRAAAGLAWCALDGCGSAPQPDQAPRWLSQLQAREPARALYLRWWQMQQASPLQLHPDQVPATGQSLLQQAAGASDAQALNALGLQAVSAGDWTTARRYFTQAASRSPAAQRNLQRIQWQGESDGAQRSNTALPGEAFWQRARAYHRGDGVPVNFTEALRLYQAAAAQGHPRARQMLALIYSRPQPDGQVPMVWMQQLAHAEDTLPSSSPALIPSDVRLYAQDPTPLYDWLPAEWRALRTP